LWQAVPEPFGDKPGLLPITGLAPNQQPVVFAQALALAEVPPPGVVQTQEAIHLAQPEQRHQRVGAEASVG
jgi:hypothetical protein